MSDTAVCNPRPKSGERPIGHGLGDVCARAFLDHVHAMRRKTDDVLTISEAALGRVSGWDADGPSLTVPVPVAASAVVAVALHLARSNPAGLILQMPVRISTVDPASLTACLSVGFEAAMAGWIGCIATDHLRWRQTDKQIRLGAPLASAPGAFAIVRETPSASASHHAAAAACLWDTGIILSRADVFLAEVGRYAPQILSAVQTAIAECGDNWTAHESFARMGGEFPQISIQHAVLKKTERVAAVLWPGLPASRNPVRATESLERRGEQECEPAHF